MMTTNLRSFLGACLVVIGAGVAGCAGMNPGAGWVTVVDGTSIDGWAQVGKGNWSIAGGTVQGVRGEAGYIVSKDSYTDFEIRAEFWADEDANSGIFIRCQDRNKIGADTCYEVNIFDKRPDPTYGTGAIVDVAKVVPMPKAANKWNLYEITARGDKLIVVLNGQKTVDVRDGKHRAGPIAPQSAGGTIRFRKVQIRSL
ncbi:MAG: DUF1080 domain-containing protein [Betaproteobacteria bacterium]